jgi:hypothetical protein
MLGRAQVAIRDDFRRRDRAVPNEYAQYSVVQMNARSTGVTTGGGKISYYYCLRLNGGFEVRFKNSNKRSFNQGRSIIPEIVFDFSGQS